MTGFNHALAGIGIAITVKNPALVAPIALVSHFILDMLPHFYLKSFGDTATRPYPRGLRYFLAGDAVVTLFFVIVALYMWPQYWLAIIVGVLFAMAPDFLWPWHGKIKKMEKFFNFHQKIQWFENRWGILFEAPFTAVLAWLIYFN